MRILLLNIAVLLITNTSIGQNVTLDQVVSFYKKKLVTVEEMLSSKGWELTRAEEPGGFMMGTSTFAFGKSEYDNAAYSFITFRYGSDGIIETVHFQVNSTKKYTSYMTRLKAMGYKLAKSQVEEGSIQKIYRDKTMTFLIKSITTEEDGVIKSFYTFFLYRTMGNTNPNTFSRLLKL